MSIFHRHRWTNWETIDHYIGEYVLGGGTARVLIQRRYCEKCRKVELDRQTA